MKNILEVENLGIIIDGEKIVKDISFLVHDQHITCIVGESGSGKDQGRRRGAVYADLIRGL